LYDACGQLLAHPHHSPVERVRGGRRVGTPLNEAAVSTRLDMVGILASWSALVVQERGVRGPGRRSVRDLADFLCVHLDWLTAHEAAGDFAAEITELTRVGQATAYPVPVHQAELGPCARPGCRKTVYTTLGAVDFEEPPALVRCADGHVWPPSQWLLLRHRHQRPAS
jgi:hypothetical protein